MDIHSIAHYLKVGYRVRRASWEPQEYMRASGDELEKKEMFGYHTGIVTNGATKLKYVRYLTNSMNPVMISDLLANDWEIITTGIRKYFNKSGNMEYDDEEDWDNYVCTSSWDDDEEE